MEASEILLEMARVYEGAKTYADRGIVRHYPEASEAHKHRVAFRSAYAKPDKLLFEWVETPVIEDTYRLSAFWKENGRVTRKFYSQSEATPCPSLEYAATAAAGLSKGAAVTILGYLLPELRDRMRVLLRLRNLAMEPDTVVGGIACHVVRGETWQGGSEILYIDKTRHCLMRTDVHFVIKPGVDEKYYQALKTQDPEQAEQYRLFRESQTEERRFYNRIDYHEVDIDIDKSALDFEITPDAKDLRYLFNIV